MNIYLKHHPKDWMVFAFMGYEYFKNGLYDLALEAYMKANRLNPSKKEIKDSIVMCREKLKAQAGHCQS